MRSFARVACALWIAGFSAGCEGDIGVPFDFGPDATSVIRDAAPADDDDAGIVPSPPRPDGSMVVDAAAPEDAARPDAAKPEDSGRVDPPDAGPPVPKPPVTFEPTGGGFSSPFMLKLTAGEQGASLHYTTDGSVPTPSSPQATAPIAINTTTMVRVIAAKSGISSPVFTQSYFELDATVQSFSSNLPVMVVHMLGGAAPVPTSREYVPAMMGLFTPGSDRSELAGTAEHTSRLGIKIRGRSSRMKAKPSYTIELWGRLQEDAPASLVGMPEDGDWVLYAPFDWDKTMMHNVFAYDLSRKLGRYAPRTQYCELFVVTGSAKVTMASYVGVYVLTERLTRSADRIAVEALQPTDITEPAMTGGYVVKVDQPDVPEEGFNAAGLTFVYDEPDVDDIAPEQKTYIAQYLDACKRAVSAADGRDPMTGKHYGELMDVPSFIDHHILNLLLKNPDAFALSSFFYKPRGGKLFAGPLWDFDLAMGTVEPWGNRSLNPMYWGPDTGSAMFKRSFWTHLFNHPDFTTAYWARFDELLASTFTSAKFRETVDALERQVTEAEARNRARWPEGAPRDNSYVAEIDALQTWLDARLAWVTANKGVVPP